MQIKKEQKTKEPTNKQLGIETRTKSKTYEIMQIKRDIHDLRSYIILTFYRPFER